MRGAVGGAVYPTVPATIDELRECNLSARCPGCNDKITLNPVAGPVATHDNAYFIANCPNKNRLHCRPIFAVYQPLNNYIAACYPIPSHEPSWLDEAIPEGIRDVYSEALRCIYAKAYRGAAAMFRRVVEAAACDKLGEEAQDKKGRTLPLPDVIDRMHVKGLITADVKESAHEVRLIGNYGAHVQDDGLDAVTLGECDNIHEITWQLLQTLYIAPAKTADLRRKRLARKANTVPSGQGDS